MKSESVNHLVVSDSLWPHIIHGILQVKILEWVAIPSSRGSSQPRDWTQISHIAGEFFTAEPLGKPKNAGVGSLSLLQGIFLTQKSNWGLLHCRWTLYQLSYQGIPRQWGDEVNGEGVRRQLFLPTMALLSCLKAALGDLLQVKSNLSFSRWVGVQEVPTELSPGKWVIYWEASKKKKKRTYLPRLWRHFTQEPEVCLFLLLPWCCHWQGNSAAEAKNRIPDPSKAFWATDYGPEWSTDKPG